MRQIKFRGKRLDNGEWIVGDLLRNRGETFIAPDGIANPLATFEDFHVNPATVGQFTGLLDKNGKVMYEGDIVNAIAKAKYPKETIVSDIICDENASSSFCVRASIEGIDRRVATHGLHLMWGGWESLEVIGSIHDNPELLK